jgi:hypothetical protein
LLYLGLHPKGLQLDHHFAHPQFGGEPSHSSHWRPGMIGTQQMSKWLKYVLNIETTKIGGIIG